MSAPEPITFNNTVLRDGHQSLAATRMSTEQMLPALPALDALGFGCLETWGGATIDSGLRFLREFPFKRLDAIRAGTRTPHMMLLRGQNIVAYAHQPDDVVSRFVELSAQHGMDIFRIFDALNDTRNMQCAIEAAKKAGKQAHGTICYTKSPVHTIEGFIQLGCELAEMGCDAIVIKDMAGLIPPVSAAQMIEGLKRNIQLPVWIHTHDSAGLGTATYMAAIDAGVDAVDTSIVPFANGTGQPDTVRMISHLQGHPRRPDYDQDKLMELRRYFEGVYAELSEYTSHANERVDSDAMTYEVPGGMLSNFRKQLKDFKMEDRFEDVFREIPVVREALGWIPLVTPTSQIVGMQAFMNVKFGRWKQLSDGAADVALGYFGRGPAPVDPEIVTMAAKATGKDPITARPADLKEPALPRLKKELAEAGLPDDDEHAVIHAMFPQQLAALYKEEPKEQAKPAPQAAPPPGDAATTAAPVATATPALNNARFAMTIEGRRHEVTVEVLR